MRSVIFAVALLTAGGCGGEGNTLDECRYPGARVRAGALIEATCPEEYLDPLRGTELTAVPNAPCGPLYDDAPLGRRVEGCNVIYERHLQLGDESLTGWVEFKVTCSWACQAKFDVEVIE
jgi:hypothetical protein